MDIAPLSSSPLAATPGILALNPAETLAAEQELLPGVLAPSLTTVDLSPLGRFLSATTVFQKKILELQLAAANNSQPIPEPELLAATTATLADAFNDLQANTVDGSLSGQSFAALFTQQFDAQTVPAAGDEDQDAALPGFAAIGLKLDTANVTGNAVLAIDQPVLTAALDRDPAATVALLGQAATAFATLAGAARPLAPAEPPAAAVAAAPSEVRALPERDDAFLEQLLNDAARAPAAAPSEADARIFSEAEFLSLPSTSEVTIEPEVQDQVDRVLADQAQASRTAAIAEDDKAQRARDDERTSLRAANSAQQAARADQRDTGNRLAEQRREQQALAAGTVAAEPALLTEPLTPGLSLPPRAQTIDSEAAPVSLPPQTPLERAQQLARDPATAAAIAAYNLNSGPFAALNGRPDLAAPKVRVIPPVAQVARVAAVDSSSDTRAGTGDLR